MGSWSETCGLSGMEIGCGERAYVCLVRATEYNLYGAVDLYVPQTTFIRGTYDDYGHLMIDDDPGVLAVFNAQANMSLKLGDHFSPDAIENSDMERVWIHEKAMDFLSTITPEFPYYGRMVADKYESVKIGSISEAVELRKANVLGVFEDAKQYVNRADEVALVRQLIAEMRLREAFGGETCGRVQYTELVTECLRSNQSIDAILEASLRNWIVEYGYSELRRKIVPSERCGPQHGGEVASLQFANFLITAQRERADN